MNALCYKIVFSKRLGTLVAVGEHTVGQGKTASGSGVRNVVNGVVSSFIGALSAVFAAVALTFLTASFTASVGLAAGPAANALPSGASVNSGSVAISSTSSSNAAVMNITQTTDKASVNWNSFNIGSAARVNVQQNSASSVLLNRVVGNDPSQIFGKLSANGQVILINPNGIVFGSGGSVTASAFTASTFGLSEQDFANNKYKFTRSGSAAGVTVQDGATLNATAPGGYIALIGASVDNQGRISTQQGAVVLAAGESVALPASLTNNISVPLSGKVRLELLPSTINAMVANSGTITTEGGQVLMQAAALSDAVASITHTGTIDTTGAQGGAVTLLADGGVIKATGSIKANSSGNDEHGQLRKGGDIIIGRDEETSVLARATDVSGAKLESLGGFVETSGDYLKTDGISVKAKDWLLDPTDINIVATGTVTPDTDTVPGSGLYLDTTGLSTSEVLTGTIQTAINNGTNVTISTANSAVGANGSGNITIFDKLAFANNSGQDATLTLLAKNGIEQKVGATIIQTAGSNNRKVNVVMTSEGLHGGNSVASTNSKGITLNAAITTNGDVTLNGTTNNSGAASASNAIGVDIKSAAAITAKNISITGKSESSLGIQSASVLNATNTVTLEGTSKNWVGVVTTGAITATNGLLSIKGTKGTATDASGFQGININSNLTGASVSLIGTSYGHYGVQVQNVTVKSTAGDVYIEGTGSNTAITTGQNESSGTRIAGIVDAKAKAIIKGTTSDAGLYQGLIISNQVKGASVEITGVASNHIGAAVNNGAKVTASAGDVIINGTSNTNEGLGVGSQSTNGGATITATGSVTLTGTSNSSLIKSGTAGVRFWGSNSVTASNAINITGIVDTLVNKSGVGVEFQRYGSASSLKTTNGDINISGTLTGNGGGSGVRMGESGWGAQAPMISAGGNFTLRGNNRAATTNASPAISASGGMQVNAGGNIVVQAETNNATVAAMSFYSGAASIWGNALQANTSFITSKNVLIQANQGGIVFNNSITPTITSGVAPNVLTALTDIQGKNITIDNTGAGMVTGATNIVGAGSIDAITGAVTTAGSGGATGGTSGVNIDGRKITATGNLNIMGVAKGTGSGIGSNAVLTADGAVNLTGKSVGGTGLISAGAMKSNNDAVSIIGTSTGSTGASGSDIQGTVTAKSDIKLEGYSGNISNVQGLLIRNAVNSTAGDITVKGETKSASQRAVAITANGANNGSLKVADGKNININANTLLINNFPSTFVDAGPNGSVNIKTTTAGNEIKIGFPDGPNATLGSQVLGIDNGELNLIKAGNLVIGDTASAGKISIAAATNTLAQTGNIVLQTGGNIDVNAALTIAPDKTLTLNGAGTSSTISQTNTNAGITADKVEFLGSNATVTLQPTGIPVSSANKIGVIAGNVKSFALTNQRDLKVSVVNGTTGLTAVNDIKLTTTTATGTALSIENKIESTAGDVIINATTSDTSAATPPLAAVKSSAQVKGKDITMNAVALGASGKTLGYYGAGANGVFTALNNLTLIGSTKNQGSGFYMFEGTLSARNVLSIEGTSALGQGVGFDKTSTSPNVSITSGNGITITGTASNSTSSVHQGAINLKDVNLTNTAGAVTLTAINGDIDTSGTGTLIQNGNDGVKLTTLGHGNITVPKIINNGTGNVVIAAGSDLLAGDGTGGQVKTVAANTITQGNTTPGKTYIYSGNATDTDLLSRLDSTLGNLQVDGTATQNVDTNAAFGAGTGISGSTAKAQVIFREKVTITNGLVGTTLAKTYGDAETKNTATAALLTETKAKLKQEGGNLGTLSGTSANYTTPTPTSGNVIKIAKTAIIDSLTGNLDGAAYSGAQYLRANGTYKYNTTANPLTSSKYDIVNTTFTGDVNVTVAQKALTGTIASGNSTYGDSLNLATAGATTLTGKLTGDNVTAGISTVVLNATNTSTSGNLIAGTHTQTLTGVSGTDEANYSHAGVTGSYTVNKLALAGSIAQGNSTYGNPLAAGTANFSNVKGSGASTDVVTATGVTIDTIGNTSTSGNLKAGTHNGIQSVAGITGKDADNYTFAAVKGGYKVDQRPLSALYAANDKVYDGNNSATVVGSLQNTITGDLVNPTHTGATFDTFAVGTNKTVTVTGISLSGVDLANYKIDPVANPTFTATARAAITPGAPPPPAPVVPTNATTGGVKIPLSAANPFRLASAEELGGEDFCENTSIDPLNGDSTGNSNSSCTCEESKLAQDAQICFEKNTQKISAQ